VAIKEVEKEVAKQITWQEGDIPPDFENV